MNYVLKLKTCPDNPAHACFRATELNTYRNIQPDSPLGLRILPLFKDSKIKLDVVDDTKVTPWSQCEPQICLSDKM